MIKRLQAVDLAFARGDAEEAERLFVEALRIEPGNADALANLRRVRVARGGR